jgi:carbonic anhydrase
MLREFVTCLNCMDGRVQLPVINWILSNYEIKYVDMITAPGMDGLLSDSNDINDILEKITISRNVHFTDHIFIVGHYNCLANPVNDETHKKQIVRAVKRIKEFNSHCSVIGLWVEQSSIVHQICKI